MVPTAVVPQRVRIPARPATLLPRQHLRPHLERISQVRIVAITAPAGFGKTSLLIDMATSRPPFPVAWYTLGDGDNDVWRFLTHMVAAIQVTFPHFGERILQALSRDHQVWSQVRQQFLIELSTLPDMLVVLDDFHLADDEPSISELISALAQTCQNVHLMLASRSIPKLPQSMQLVARGQLFGLDFEALRFSLPETTRLLREGYQYSLSDEQIAQLVQTMDGWITGILLAVQATNGLRNPLQLLAALGDKPVYSFLAEQVLSGLSTELQQFLQVTSLLDSFTVEEANNLRQADDSAYLLDEAMQRGLFISVSSNGFRYHPQFREFLRSRFRTYEHHLYVATARRVASLAEASGDWLRAFDMLADIGARADMVRLLGSVGVLLHQQGRVETLRRLLGYLALDELTGPLICLKAFTELNQGRWREAGVLADLALARARETERGLPLLIRAQVALNSGNLNEAIVGCRALLDMTSDPAIRVQALRTLGVATFQTGGDTEAALGFLREALELYRELGDVYQCALVRSDLGACYGHMGDLASATTYFKDADATWRVLGNDTQRALTLNNLAVILHQAGSYVEAMSMLNEASLLAQTAGHPRYQALIAVSQGDLLSDMQRFDEASAAYGQARRLEQHLSANMRTALTISIANIERRRRRFDTATAALESLAAHADNPSVLAARAMLAAARGDFDTAEPLLNAVVEPLRTHGHWIELARVALFQAWVRYSRQEPIEIIRERLDEAVRIADSRMGHDRFLQAELAPMRAMVRLAAGTGWPRAQLWLATLAAPASITQPAVATDHKPVVTVVSFGDDGLLVDRQPVSLGWRKAREVFYYLLWNGNSATPEQIREAIWPDDDGISALKSAMYQLRRALPPSILPPPIAGRYTVNLNQVTLEYDVAQFRRLCESHEEEELLDALQFYRGPFLAQYSSSWCREPRTELAGRALKTQYALADYYERHRRPADALTIYRSILTSDNTQARAYTGMMRCFIALGDRGAALESYATLARMTYDVHGITLPSDDEAEQLYRRLIAN